MNVSKLRQFKSLGAVFFGMLVLFIAQNANAADSQLPKKKPAKAINCPTVIANRSNGSYTAASKSSKRNMYQCYKNKADAEENGFLSTKELSLQDYSGWWRLGFTSTKDTCGNQSGRSGPVFFLQVVQHGQAVYGDFCPSIGRLSGVRTGSGFSASLTSQTNDFASNLGCKDGIVEQHQQLELSSAVSGANAYTARLVTVLRCPAEDEGARSCTIEYNGIAFSETHPFWPSVDANVSNMAAGCGTALTRCKDCHENLSNTNLHP